MEVKKNRAIFLDRDGTINKDWGYVYRVEDWEIADDQVPEAMRKLQQQGYKIIVVTNQSGIGHGLYTQEDMAILHQHMEAELKKEGVIIDLILFCPHARDEGCKCRKPGTGMVEEASKLMGGIDFTASWTIGDKIKDIQMGVKVGTKTALLRSKYWNESELSDKRISPDLVADTLIEVAQYIVSGK